MTTGTDRLSVPGQPSDESTKKQLELAREQGDSFGRAVRMMVEEEASGEQTEVGDLLVGYAVEEAEGMYRLVDGNLEWQNPSDENAHIEIVVRDARDGRFVPGLEVTVTVRSEDGTEIGSHRQPFLWHPWLYHYGRNWILPKDGTYSLEVHVEAADFMRHDKTNGARFGEAVDVEFSAVEIETGQKIS